MGSPPPDGTNDSLRTPGVGDDDLLAAAVQDWPGGEPGCTILLMGRPYRPPNVN